MYVMSGSPYRLLIMLDYQLHGFPMSLVTIFFERSVIVSIKLPVLNPVCRYLVVIITIFP